MGEYMGDIVSTTTVEQLELQRLTAGLQQVNHEERPFLHACGPRDHRYDR